MRALILRCTLLAGLYALATTPFAGFNQANGKNAASPALIYSTYLGGTARENDKAGSDMKASAIAVDAEGNVYVAGNTVSTDFPGSVTIGAVSPGVPAIFVVKYNPEGASVYSTRVGGSSLQRGFGIAVDSAGNAYVTGRTQSTDFPVVNAAQPRFGGKEDAFVFKLNPAGNALVYSTYLGGSGTDFACGIAIDSAGNAYVTGDSESADFPITLGAAQRQFAGGLSDGFVIKLNASGSAFIYASYLGGTGFDHGESIATGKDGSAYVTGYTSSADFPTVRPVQPAFAGNIDAFAAKLNESGSALVYSTYLGGASVDGGTSVTVDSAGNAFVAGTTASSEFPVTRGALQPSFGGSQDAFVTMLNPEGSALTYSTFLGGTNLDGAYGITVGSDGRAYITGATRSPEFQTLNAFQAKHAGNDEVFVTTLDSSGGLLYSSFLGGTGWDLGDGIAMDKLGNVYLTGRTNSSDFPTVKASQPGYGGNWDAFVTKISALNAGASFISVSAASYAKDGPLAPESIASGFGANLAAGLEQAQGVPLPETLRGVTVKIRDSAGTERAAPLFFVSPNQINYFVTTGTRAGPATVSVWNQEKLVAAGTVQIDSVAPGLFSKNGDGRGVPAALAVKVTADGTQTVSPVFQCGGEPGSCVTTPVDLGSPTDQVILLLFGTGIRGRSALDAVKASIGGVDAEVLYAGAQNEFPGLDQLNVRLPRSLAGRGKVDVILLVDGRSANTLELYIR